MLPVLAQVGGHLASTMRVQLAEQVVDVRLRRCQADVQPAGDLLVAEPGPDQFGSLPFAFGERGYREWRVVAAAGAGGEGDPAEQPGGDPAGADLLATMDFEDLTREIGQSGRAPGIGAHNRLRPADDVLLWI